MFCPNCGSDVPENVQFCSKCGRNLSVSSPVEEGKSVAPAVERPGRKLVDDPERLSKMKWLGIAGAAVGIILGILVTIWLTVTSDGDSLAEDEPVIGFALTLSFMILGLLLTFLTEVLGIEPLIHRNAGTKTIGVMAVSLAEMIMLFVNSPVRYLGVLASVEESDNMLDLFKDITMSPSGITDGIAMILLSVFVLASIIVITSVPGSVSVSGTAGENSIEQQEPHMEGSYKKGVIGGAIALGVIAVVVIAVIIGVNVAA